MPGKLRRSSSNELIIMLSITVQLVPDDGPFSRVQEAYTPQF